MPDSAILLVHCPDKKGIVHRITEFIDNNNGNILALDQHVDREDDGVFFMRIEWELDTFLIPREKIGDYFDTQIAARYDMKWNLYFSDNAPNMALFVTKMDHCLYDILARYQAGEWNVKIPIIISNHEDLRPVAERFNIPFHCFPVTKETKKDVEEQEMELLRQQNIDFVVLARYMQVISEDFIRAYPNKIINIHHSFLPAFPGAKPYHSAYRRGVKIIGATSHYVTTDLDEGPIIEQDVTRVTHRDSIQTLVRKGRDLEKIVLSRAIYLHLRRRILTYDNRTIVFA